MTGITVECIGSQGLRVDHQRQGASDTVYLAEGEQSAFDEAFLVQVSAAEAGEPRLRLVNASKASDVDVYSVRGSQVTRRHTLRYEHSQPFWLAEGERLLLIPILGKAS